MSARAERELEIKRLGLLLEDARNERDRAVEAIRWACGEINWGGIWWSDAEHYGGKPFGWRRIMRKIAGLDR